MQKLQLSFKIVLQIPRTLSHEPHLCKKPIFSHTETKPNTFYSSLTQSHSSSHLCFRSSRSLRSHHTISKGFSGVFRNPEVLKHLVRNTHLKIRSRDSFYDRIVVLFRRSPIQRYNYGNNLPATWSRIWRSWFPTTDSAVWGLISANIAVFMLWRVADPRFMMENFMISVHNFMSGRVHTVITSAFSHHEMGHLFSNMIGLYFFGTSIGRTFGPHFLLKLYLAGAVGGSVLYLIYHALQSPTRKGAGIFNIVDPQQIPGLGASGAVNAIILLDIFLVPMAIHYVNLMVPVPAVLIGAYIIGSDVYRMMNNNSQISGSAHMGGALVAALAWARIKKRWI